MPSSTAWPGLRLTGSLRQLTECTARRRAPTLAALASFRSTWTAARLAGSPNAPLSGDHKAELQKHVDELHSQFAGNVARNRGMSPAAVAKVADGRVFLAGEAHKHGLIDGIKTFGEVLAGLTKRAATAEAPKPAARAPALDVAARARVYIEQQARLGRRVSAADAVAHISTLI
jgi:ClpP class serine protease